MEIFREKLYQLRIHITQLWADMLLLHMNANVDVQQVHCIVKIYPHFLINYYPYKPYIKLNEKFIVLKFIMYCDSVTSFIYVYDIQFSNKKMKKYFHNVKIDKICYKTNISG